MPAGFQVFNADGSLQFDTTNRLFRTLFETASGTSNGSAAVPVATGNVTVTVTETDGKIAPNASVVGGTLSWNFNDIPVGERGNAKILVEVF